MGSPVIDGSLAYIDCTVTAVHDGGDHFVVFGAVKSLSEVPKIKPRPLLFYRGDYTGIEPDKTTPAQWRDDLEAFLTTTTQDTWLPPRPPPATPPPPPPAPPQKKKKYKKKKK